MITNFLIGTDFEFFVKNEAGRIASAIGKIGGTKQAPLSIGNDCDRQEDNVLAEFNIPPVNSNERQRWLNYFQYVKRVGQKILNPHGLTLYASTSEIVDEEFLLNPIARRFGCEASYSAYSSTPRVDLNADNPLRTAGFHIHIGFKEDMEGYDYERLMRVMDYFIGIPSVVIDPDRVRRQRYGQAGEYRFAIRGDYNVIEYRSLGSFFLKSEELIGWVFDQTVAAVKAFNEGLDPSLDLQHIINNYDVNGALFYIEKDTRLSENVIINQYVQQLEVTCQ